MVQVIKEDLFLILRTTRKRNRRDVDYFVMSVTFIVENRQELTKEQLREIEEAKKYPITFDEDCQELSPAMMKAFRSAVVQRNSKKKA